ncbi:hypothetical protein KC19_VG200700 [Ceratodon purpureus]|uniref:Uncharacterized protein n=1 Tax=Ceratodon purpureus TaxID=3225 RepID=A0A8T0HSA9_CERPU|nr:hypothetical protein KC19_VG200700 [Ceratodon purpureus]
MKLQNVNPIPAPAANNHHPYNSPHKTLARPIPITWPSFRESTPLPSFPTPRARSSKNGDALLRGRAPPDAAGAPLPTTNSAAKKTERNKEMVLRSCYSRPFTDTSGGL